jgi:PPOX class probable F420-dependent enzyme
MPGFIPWHKVDNPLRAFRSIWLSTTRPDGRPHAMPVWFWWTGKAIYFTTHRDSQKARNLAQQAWVVIHAGDGDDVIILQGTADVVIDQAEKERVNGAYMEKYVDPYSGARATVLSETDIIYRVNIGQVMTWEYGSMNTRTDWRFEEGGW